MPCLQSCVESGCEFKRDDERNRIKHSCRKRCVPGTRAYRPDGSLLERPSRLHRSLAPSLQTSSLSRVCIPTGGFLPCGTMHVPQIPHNRQQCLWMVTSKTASYCQHFVTIRSSTSRKCGTAQRRAQMFLNMHRGSRLQELTRFGRRMVCLHWILNASLVAWEELVTACLG